MPRPFVRWKLQHQKRFLHFCFQLSSWHPKTSSNQQLEHAHSLLQSVMRFLLRYFGNLLSLELLTATVTLIRNGQKSWPNEVDC